MSIIEIKKYLARCDNPKCCKSIMGWNGNNVMGKDDLTKLLGTHGWEYNFKTKKCRCADCRGKKL